MSEIINQTDRITEAKALEHLHTCAGALRLAYAAAHTARGGLDAARATRCAELLDILADGLNYASRLSMVVLGDVRAAHDWETGIEPPMAAAQDTSDTKVRLIDLGGGQWQGYAE